MKSKNLRNVVYYDPCFSCATHTIPGQMTLEFVIKDVKGSAIKMLTQNL